MLCLRSVIGFSSLLSIASFASSSGAAESVSPPAPLWATDAGSVPVGTNLNGIHDWSTEFTFADPFKASRSWFSGAANTWQDQRPLDLDEHGWVRSLQAGQMAKTLLFWDLSRAPGKYPAGRYVVEYEGEGTIEYGGSAKRIEKAKGRDVLDVDPNRGGGIGIFITATNSQNYIRNIRVHMPGDTPADEPFYPVFLERLKGYRVIRFMNWTLGQNNNNIHLTTWDERPKLDDARWSVKGVPVEVMVSLANRMQADPWFCLSHLADDDSVRRFAQAVKESLAPKLKVYVEHSNEVWNGQFPSARYARQRGQALGLSQNEFEGQIRYHAQRTREIGAIFTEVLGKDRVVRVLGGWSANARSSETALSHANTAAGVDALAIAPYFGINVWDPKEQAKVPTMKLDDLMRELETASLPAAKKHMQDSAAVARKHKVSLIAYEGGQHLVGVGPGQNDEKLNALFDAANRDPRMGSLYTRYLSDWADASGGGLFVNFTLCGGFSKYGRFGVLEYLDQPRGEAPKYDSLLRFMAAQSSARAK